MLAALGAGGTKDAGAAAAAGSTEGARSAPTDKVVNRSLPFDTMCEVMSGQLGQVVKPETFTEVSGSISALHVCCCCFRCCCVCVRGACQQGPACMLSTKQLTSS